MNQALDRAIKSKSATGVYYVWVASSNVRTWGVSTGFSLRNASKFFYQGKRLLFEITAPDTRILK